MKITNFLPRVCEYFSVNAHSSCLFYLYGQLCDVDTTDLSGENVAFWASIGSRF